jgi:Ni,Fe-hydrogenase III large subunit
MEIERIASHIGDFGGICADIGFSGGNALFSRLRGQTLGLGEMLTGARFMTSYVLPGGVKRAPPQQICERLTKEIETLEQNIVGAIPALLDNSGALARMENVGRVRQSTARDFGLVGPAGRASGIDYDVRRDFRQEPYSELNWNSAKGEGGDVYSRVKIRADEIRASLAILRDLAGIVKELNADRENLVLELPESLPSQQYGVGIVESWRGELIHLVYTSENGISRYAIKDPSFNNWTGLAIAVRGQLVADFPLCNKSFNLSYSGNDL